MTALPEIFRVYLISQNLSPVTVKNYLADVRHFLNWLAKKTGIKYQVAGSAIFGIFTEETIKEYQKDLLSANTPPSTINRHLSALRKLSDFARTQGWLQINPAEKIGNLTESEVKILTGETNEEKMLAEFQADLEKEKVSPLTTKNYLVDVRHFLGWLK